MNQNTSSISKIQQALKRLASYILSHEYLLALTISIIYIFIGLSIGVEGSQHLALNHAPHAHYNLDKSNKLVFLANWDGADYLKIANHGYFTSFLTGWFPVYPIMIKAIDWIIGSYLFSGLLISWLCLSGAVYYFIKIIKLKLNISSNLEAAKAVLLFLLYPTGFYLICVYTESLFALLSLATIYYALKRRYLLVGLLTMTASATHFNGVFLIAFAALILFEQKLKLRNIAISLLIGSLGLIAYMIFLFSKYAKPLAFFSAQKQHGWLHHGLFASLGSIGIFNLMLFLLVLASAVYWWKSRRSFSFYSLLYLLIPLVGGQFDGFPRYSLMVFPVTFMIYWIVRKRSYAYLVTLSLSSIVWAYLLIKFSAGYIVG
jgi:hypothetical protein